MLRMPRLILTNPGDESASTTYDRPSIGCWGCATGLGHGGRLVPLPPRIPNPEPQVGRAS
eukprot:scaffold10297_cov113-Isochrysis_galbana.AAC.20